jgi:signal transduction histidine kinase
MIEKMGGTVKVDSIEGVGTTFSMFLMMKAKVGIEPKQES